VDSWRRWAEQFAIGQSRFCDLFGFKEGIIRSIEVKRTVVGQRHLHDCRPHEIMEVVRKLKDELDRVDFAAVETKTTASRKKGRP